MVAIQLLDLVPCDQEMLQFERFQISCAVSQVRNLAGCNLLSHHFHDY